MDCRFHKELAQDPPTLVTSAMRMGLQKGQTHVACGAIAFGSGGTTRWKWRVEFPPHFPGTGEKIRRTINPMSSLCSLRCGEESPWVVVRLKPRGFRRCRTPHVRRVWTFRARFRTSAPLTRYQTPRCPRPRPSRLPWRWQSPLWRSCSSRPRPVKRRESWNSRKRDCRDGGYGKRTTRRDQRRDFP